MRKLARLGVCVVALGMATSCERTAANSSHEKPAAEVAVPAPFVDVTDLVGLDFRHDPHATGRRYFCEIMGGGAALFDYDSDGDLDLYLTQGAALDADSDPQARDRLFRNDLGPDGMRFVEVTAESGIEAREYGMGVATGDIDNDGDVDLYVTNFGVNRLFRNDGDGSFTDITDAAGVGDPSWGVGATFFDYDRDGFLDLFVTNYVDFELGNHKECFDPSGFPDYCAPSAYAPVPDRLYHNQGGGRFRDVSAESGIASAYGAGLGVVATDADGDGWLDVFVANDQGANLLWMNAGDGTFSNRAMIAGCAMSASGRVEASMGVAAGDYDGDRDEDLLLSHLTRETNTLYRNDGGGYYTDATDGSGLGGPSLPFTGFGVAWLDFDNDSWLDLFVANGAVMAIPGADRTRPEDPYRQVDQLFHNRRGEGFAVRELGPPRVGRGVALGDIDNDGDTDMIVCNAWEKARVFRNDVGQSSRWVGLRVVDAKGQRLHARIEATLDDGRVLHRTVRRGGSYLAASDPRLIFGLGDASLKSIRVRWLDGRVEQFAAPESNRWSSLEPGTGRVVRD